MKVYHSSECRKRFCWIWFYIFDYCNRIQIVRIAVNLALTPQHHHRDFEVSEAYYTHFSCTVNVAPIQFFKWVDWIKYIYMANNIQHNVDNICKCIHIHTRQHSIRFGFLFNVCACVWQSEQVSSSSNQMLNHANLPKMFSIEGWQKAIITFSIVRTTAHNKTNWLSFCAVPGTGFAIFFFFCIPSIQFLIRSFNSIYPFANLLLVDSVWQCVRADFVGSFIHYIYRKVDTFSIRGESSCIKCSRTPAYAYSKMILYANVSFLPEAIVQSSSHIINYLINLNSIYIYRIHARLIPNVDQNGSVCLCVCANH